jgi:hypothetical protein
VRGQFNEVNLPGDVRDPVPVSGPLQDVDPNADHATIVCVLVQGDLNPAGGQNPVWVEGTGSWNKGDTDWTGTVSREGRVINSGLRRDLVLGDARGIAVAVAVREEPPGIGGKLVPPSIDVITWCVNIELK